MSTKIRWGVLSTANIGMKKVIPGMQQGEHAPASPPSPRAISPRRRRPQPRSAFPLPTAPTRSCSPIPNIDAIYNPLPNHLHVPWTIKAAEAGKHVLCEKPISLTVAEAETLLAVRDRTGVKIGEAFMVRSHPQWLRLRAAHRRGPHRRAALRARLLQLLQHQPGQHPQQGRHRRRRPDGHRLLSDPGGALRASRQEPHAWSSPRSTATRRCTPTGSPPRSLTSTAAARPSLPAAPSWFPTSASTSSAPRDASSWRSRSTRRPTAPPASSSTSGSDLFGGGITRRDLPRLRPVHAAGRRLLARHPGQHRGPGSGRRRHPEYGGHRSHLPLRQLRPVGDAITNTALRARCRADRPGPPIFAQIQMTTVSPLRYKRCTYFCSWRFRTCLLLLRQKVWKALSPPPPASAGSTETPAYSPIAASTSTSSPSNSTFEETTYLLWFGKLPTAAELADFSAQLAAARELDPKVIELLAAFPPTPRRWRSCAPPSRCSASTTPTKPTAPTTPTCARASGSPRRSP